ncbi:MAG: peptide deformylase [bacterium]
MTVLPIRLYGDPVLRAVAKPIARWDAPLLRLARDMEETMRAANGVGLAAPQVGETHAILVAQLPDDIERMDLITLANPEIIEEEGAATATEGCLSIPDIEEDVERATHVRVRGLLPSGETVEIEANGYLARVLQHEIDHLKGILYIDRISAIRRRLLKRRLDEIKRQSEEMRDARS